MCYTLKKILEVNVNSTINDKYKAIYGRTTCVTMFPNNESLFREMKGSSEYEHVAFRQHTSHKHTKNVQ